MIYFNIWGETLVELLLLFHYQEKHNRTSKESLLTSKWHSLSLAFSFIRHAQIHQTDVHYTTETQPYFFYNVHLFSCWPPQHFFLSLPINRCYYESNLPWSVNKHLKLTNINIGKYDFTDHMVSFVWHWHPPNKAGNKKKKYSLIFGVTRSLNHNSARYY